MVEESVGKSGAFLSAGLLALALSACAGEDLGPADLPSVGAFAELDSPAGPDSGEPFLFATDRRVQGGEDAGDRLILSWLQAAGEDHELRFSVLQDETDGGGKRQASWSEPRTIIRRPDLFVNWADFPSVIELPDGSLAAHWLQYTGPGTYSYGIRIVRSEDGGETWSGPVVPYADTSQTEHGFVALFPESDGDADDVAAGGGGVRAVWLDGRDYANPDTDPSFMALRAAAIGPDGALRGEALLDPMTCDCCQNSVAFTSAGPVVAYRGRTEGEVRDIRVVRADGAAWSEPITVHHDGWMIPACPVNGPEIVALGDTVAVTWFTNAGEVPRVLAAFSSDGGRSFDSPIRIDDGRPLGRVDAVMLSGGVILTSWLEGGQDGAEVRLRSVAIDGRSGEPVSVGDGSSERAGGFPRMAVWNDQVVLAWTIPGEPSTIRVTAASLEP